MPFSPDIVDGLLARTGRMCAICNRLHGVQVHHIVPVSAGGSDDERNAIPLCPNCHDEVHAAHAPGRTTRLYTESELRQHLQRTIELAARETALRPGNEVWNADAELVRFYAQCLDRPAFRVWFHVELSFADLDQALEDTALAMNTGYWRTRDGAIIRSAEGKSRIANRDWRARLDAAVAEIDQARQALRHALALDAMFIEQGQPFTRDSFEQSDDRLRSNHELGSEIDRLRQEVLDNLNAVLADIGDEPLGSIGG